jgi:hypothetical protein
LKGESAVGAVEAIGVVRVVEPEGGFDEGLDEELDGNEFRKSVIMDHDLQHEEQEHSQHTRGREEVIEDSS